MSNFFKNNGGRTGFHSGSGKVKNMEVAEDFKGRTHLTMGCGLVMVSSTFPYDTTANTEATAAFAKCFC